MKKGRVFIYCFFFLLIVSIFLPFLRAEKSYQNEIASLLPLTVPPDPLMQTLLDAGLDEFSAQRVKSLMEFTFDELTGMVDDKLREKIEEALIKEFPTKKAVFKKATWVISLTEALLDAGNAYIDYYEANFDPDLSIYDKQTKINNLASKTTIALASFMPPGVSDVAIGILKIGYLYVQYDNDEDEAQHRKDMEDLERKNREIQETLYDTLQTYGTTTENKQIIIDVMSNEQIIDHVLGLTKGPSGDNIQAAPDPSILDYVSGERRREIYKQMKTAIINDGLGADIQTARDLQKKYPVGSGVIIKSSPVYMLITDPFERKFGVNPETRDIICESEAVFCSPIFTHYDTQMIATPALYEGTYNIQLYGFDDGKFIFSFTGLNNNYIVESSQDIVSYIKKGQILSAEIEIERIDDSFKVKVINFTETGTFVPASKADEVPFKVVSISPKPGSFFRTEKPVIKIGFSKPVSENNPLPSLRDSTGKAYEGMVLTDKTHVTFIPAQPLGEGNYSIEVKDWHDEYGVKLSNSMNSSFSVVRKKEDELKYSLAYPIIYNITTFIKLKNPGTSKVRDIVVKDVLFQDFYPNVFVNYIGSSMQPKISTDQYGNKWGAWKVGNLDPKEEKIINYTFLVLIFNVNYFDYVDFEETSDSDALNKDFLEPSECIESDASVIQKTAREIVDSTDNAYEKAQKIYFWMINNIEYQYKGEGEAGGALQTLNTKKGVCHSFACLTAALLRDSGVQTKYILVVSRTQNQTERHASNEFYLQDYGWLPADSTWGKDVNDWFLASSTDHIKLGEENPPVTSWSSYEGGNLEIIWGEGTMNVVYPDSLWDEDLKLLYESVEAASFKKNFLQLLPKETVLNNGNSSPESFSIQYSYHEKPYPELSNSLDNETLAIQTAVDHYFEGGLKAEDRKELKKNTYLIYSGLIEEARHVVSEAELEFAALSQKREEYNKKISSEIIQSLDDTLGELESQGFDIAYAENYSGFINQSEEMFGGIGSNEIMIYLGSQGTTISLQQVMELVNQSIINSEEELNYNNYDDVREHLLGITKDLSSIEQAKMMLNIEVMGHQSFDTPINVSIIKNSLSDLPQSTVALAFTMLFALLIGSVIFFIASFLGIWMFINCLIRKEFRHLNKFLWLVIIVLLFAIGPVLYLIFEYIGKGSNKKK